MQTPGPAASAHLPEADLEAVFVPSNGGQLAQVDGSFTPFARLALRMFSARSLFVAYAFLGIVALWGSMLTNGTLDAITDAKLDGKLPSGRTLMIRITGVPLVDNGLSTLIAFFDGITNGSVLASHLLLVDLVCVIQCVTIWLMVDGPSLRERSLLMRRYETVRSRPI